LDFTIEARKRWESARAGIRISLIPIAWIISVV
jgi:hypothetical protein